MKLTKKSPTGGFRGLAVLEQVKAARKQSRDEEIQTHGKSINYRKVMESKKQYNRKKNKADDEVLPYLFWDVRVPTLTNRLRQNRNSVIPYLPN